MPIAEERNGPGFSNPEPTAAPYYYLSGFSLNMIESIRVSIRSAGIRFVKSSEKISPPAISGRGPSLFAYLYLALMAEGMLMLYAIYSVRREDEPKMKIMIGMLVVCAFLVAQLRPLIQDWYSALGATERILVYVFTGFFFLAPGVMQGHRILPEGFAFVVYPLLLLAIDQQSVRAFLACTLAGFWFALYRNPNADLPLVLGFGFATLCSLASMHFAFIGEPFGLRGSWPARRIFFTAVLYFGPASLAAYLAYRFWPASNIQSSTTVRAHQIQDELLMSRTKEMTPEEWRKFFLQLVIAIGLVAFSLTTLHYLRRFLNRRRSPADFPQIFGTDVSELEYLKSNRVERTPGFTGTRGEIVRLWKKWTRQKEEEGVIRLPSETAAELAGRVAEQAPDNERTEALTLIFERAHYGSEEPSSQDVQTMKQLVREETRDHA